VSIIYDALQKIEHQDNSDRFLNKKNKQADPAQAKQEQNSLNKSKIRISAVLLAVLGLISLIIFNRQFVVERISSLTSLVKKEYVSEAQKPLEFNLPLSSNIQAQPTSSKSYTLEGIIYDLEFPTVIINGKSFKNGDLIDEYKVVKITQSSVELVSTKDESKLILSIEF